MRAPSSAPAHGVGGHWGTAPWPGAASPPTGPASPGRGPEKEEEKIHFLNMHGDREDNRQCPRGSPQAPVLPAAAPPAGTRWGQGGSCWDRQHPSSKLGPLLLPFMPFTNSAPLCPAGPMPASPCSQDNGERVPGGRSWGTRGSLPPAGAGHPLLPQAQARLFLRAKSMPLCARPTPAPGTQLGTKHTSLLWGQ